MKKLLFVLACGAALAFGLTSLTSCGGRGNNRSGNGQEAGEQSGNTEAVEQVEATSKKQEQKAPAKKWYEQDFSLTYKQYVMTASMTRSYARKGNSVACKVDGSQTVSLYVFTDSTRTDYLINEENQRYGKKGEKTGLSGVEPGVKKYLKDQIGDNLFGNILKPDGENCKAKDTIVFGRPAYVITMEKKDKLLDIVTYSKVIEWVDKENGLAYYKYAYGKSGDTVITDGVVFEITEFSDKPTYDGFVMSLDGLADVSIQ